MSSGVTATGAPRGDDPALYAVSVPTEFPHPREKAAFQRETAHRLLAWALQRDFAADLAALPVDRGPYGKPFFPGHPARYNLTHTDGLVCCALGTREVGVDAEAFQPVNSRLEQRVCTPEELAWLDAAPDRERAFITLWTLKESLMKFTGEGIAMGFANAAFTWRQGRPVPPLPGVEAVTFLLPGAAVSVCAAPPLPREIIFVPLEDLP